MGFDPAPENGVAPSGVGAFYEQAVGVFDVVVTNGYGVFAEGHFIGGHGTAHAKAGVGVDVVAADKAFDKFVEDVVFFREALAGGVKSDGIWPVLVDHGLEYRCGAVQGLVPADALQGHIAVIAHLRMEQAIGLIVDGVLQIHALAAQFSPINGVCFVASYRYGSVFI